MNSHLFIPSINFFFNFYFFSNLCNYHFMLFHSIYEIFTPKNLQRAQKKNYSQHNRNEMKNTQERNNITISSRRSAQLDLTATLLLLISTVSICVLPTLRWIIINFIPPHTHTLPTLASGTSTQARALFVRLTIQWNERTRVVNTH